MKWELKQFQQKLKTFALAKLHKSKWLQRLGISGKYRNAVGRFLTMALLVLLSACATPHRLEPGLGQRPAQLNKINAIMPDDTALPVSVWRAKKPHAILVAAHGFNGYSADFSLPGPWFARHGITTYAYDQRGFGRHDKKTIGLWAGVAQMRDDLIQFTKLVHAKHKRLPVYVLGFSMGGAVAMDAASHGLKADGLVLVAPAIWGWQAMNPVYKSALWIGAHTLPSKTATGSGLKIWPSDNIEWLRHYSRDPLNIRATQIGTLYGLVTLMDDGWQAAEDIKMPVLYLYGAHDQIIPKRPSLATMARITANKKLMFYANGWHMLLHDKQRMRVYRDIITWIDNHHAMLPSGEELR